ncbi:DNA-J related domain-containing protein [Pseudoalteromonas ulvae]|uniref:DNA-J related domain-containing protein n=1 Tax=Pseudoalteromonas ulvae TaxID=107327 RepID=UPI00221F37B8|nr:DNA-J related domain-containing protein [Pseudoalteromonas ulvae]
MLDDVLTALLQQPQWKVHELTSMLGKQNILTTLDTDANKDLFKRNFLVMNALFTLQTELQKQQLSIEIDSFNVTLIDTSLHPRLTTPNTLANYYLNWQNYDTSAEEITQLLTDFWQQFGQQSDFSSINHTQVEQAFARFELNATSSFEAVSQRWRQLALKYHPDKAGGDTEKFQQLQNDWQLLKRHFKLLSTAQT